MGKLRRTVVTTSEAALPRGKVVRLQARITLESLVTLAIAAFAVIASAGYQVVRWRSARTRPS
jgi:hypothetical protein